MNSWYLCKKTLDMKAAELARYVIAYNDNHGELITNKKLQKLLYYIKAWGLVYFDDGIIDDDFEAWIHGPVCVVVYNQYKSFGYKPISQEYKNGSSSTLLKEFRKQQRENNKMDLIDAVITKYGSLSSFQLELLSHSERPWIEARKGLSPVDTGHSIIKVQTIKEFYSHKR